MKMLEEIVSNNLCSGCGACNVICPQNAIQMVKTNMGRIIPVIDDECIQCNQCMDVCPSVVDIFSLLQLSKQQDFFTGNIRATYRGYAAESALYLHSQSGGLVTATLAYLFDSHSIDAAIVSVMKKGMPPINQYNIVLNSDDLQNSQKSKYTPIDILSALKQTSSYSSIAIVGTACHIHGLLSLQRRNPKRYNNVKYRLGLICANVLSETANDVIGRYSKVDGEFEINYRDKRFPNYKQANTFVYTNNQKLIVNREVRLLLNDYFIPPRCRICFDKLNVGADVVFGDPWHMNGVDYDKGESLVFIRNAKAENLIKEMISKNKVCLQSVSAEEAIQGQKVTQRKKQVVSALEAYNNLGYQLPFYSSYIQDMIPITNEGLINDECHRIFCFIKMEKLSKKEIIRKIHRRVNFRMFLVIIKNRIVKLIN